MFSMILMCVLIIKIIKHDKLPLNWTIIILGLLKGTKSDIS